MTFENTSLDFPKKVQLTLKSLQLWETFRFQNAITEPAQVYMVVPHTKLKYGEYPAKGRVQYIQLKNEPYARVITRDTAVVRVHLRFTAIDEE